MLSPAGVVRELLGMALLDGGQILDGGLRVDGAPRRNQSHKVQPLSGPCYFVKQGIGPDGEALVAREAFIYRFLNSGSAPSEIQRALPRFCGYDESRRLLVLGLSPASLSLREYWARRGSIPRAAAAAIGRALAGLHGMPPPETTAEWEPGGPRYAAWPLSLHRPAIGVLRDSSVANLELIRMIQEFPAFCRLLDELRGGWRSDSLIHHDLKADNCVLGRIAGGAPRRHEVKIVDWETCGPGDPCWDVGSFFGDLLGLWLLSIPILSDMPLERRLDLTRFPLDRSHPANRAFWNAYVEGRGLTRREEREILRRAVRYSAARLLQSAFEQTQGSHRVTGNVVCLLQVAWNVLDRPAEAATRLLGLPA